MSQHIKINQEKALQKWGKIMESVGINDSEKKNWVAEYSEYHTARENKTLNENAYVNASIAGLGAVVSPQPSAYPGSTINAALPGVNGSYGAGGSLGSGDVAQNMLPISMKIAAQTIGLDLVGVKPSPGPALDLLYLDFVYDDINMNQGEPQVLKFSPDTVAYGAIINANIAVILSANGFVQTSGGFQPLFTGGSPGNYNTGNARVFLAINAAGTASILTWTGGTAPLGTAVQGATLAGGVAYLTNTPGYSKTGVVEFLGFSRIDGIPIYRAFRQYNAVGSSPGGYAQNFASAPYQYDATQNTFSGTNSIAANFTSILGVTASSTGIYISAPSALEDQLPGFSTNFTPNSQNGRYPMSRNEDEVTYAGTLGVKPSSTKIAMGTTEISSALKRTEIEDIKANTGLDLVQKMESMLVNELSQTISRQIVYSAFNLGELNRASAPLAGTSSNIPNQTIFDFDTAYANAQNGYGGGGETTQTIQRKLLLKIRNGSNYLQVEGRVGGAQYIVTNYALAASLYDIAGFTYNPVKAKVEGNQLYPVGTFDGLQVYVDPYMKGNDYRILLGRKNNYDQPGLLFVPFLMAQMISLISEATAAPRIFLRSRYAVAEVGFYPWKQFLMIHVSDPYGLLS